jgi:regulator of replication initiation timing
LIQYPLPVVNVLVARQGRRSVAQLSTAQLNRKRAKDREAQRSIRQRTKDYIESLEKNSEEMLESIKRLIKKNLELEAENKALRTQLAQEMPLGDHALQDQQSKSWAPQEFIAGLYPESCGAPYVLQSAAATGRLYPQDLAHHGTRITGSQLSTLLVPPQWNKSNSHAIWVPNPPFQ